MISLDTIAGHQHLQVRINVTCILSSLAKRPSLSLLEGGGVNVCIMQVPVYPLLRPWQADEFRCGSVDGNKSYDAQSAFTELC
jgi:hypothetical protein